MDLSLGCTRMLIDECKAQGLLRNQCAYVLATAFWESGRTMKPVREKGGEKYLKSKPYYPYVGMGFVQLTWLAGYEKASRKLGVDFVKNPKLLLDPKYAAPILVLGSAEGWFTGKKLSDYISGTKADFVGARRIINVQDKAKEIAAIAKQYVGLLQADGYGPAAQKIARLLSVPADAPVATDPMPVVPDPPTKEVIQTVQNRLRELGYNPGDSDGKIGPLTRGSILSFKNDNGLTPSDAIDQAFLAALATASPRKMAPERANATVGEVAGKIPEARVHWWTRLGAGVGGIGAGSVGLLDQATPAVGYLSPIKDFIGDVPGWIWLCAFVGVCAALYIGSQYGAKKATEAFQNGERR